ENEHTHQFTGKNDGLEGVGQFVDVEDLDAAEVRDLVEVEIVGHDLAVVDVGEFDQLHIDFANLGKVFEHNLHFDIRHLLNALEDIEAAATAVALHGITRVRHHLQLVKNELRDDENAVEKTGFGDIGDAAVDDDAGIEDFVVLAHIGF